MKRLFQLTSYAWTASGAGWLVISVVAQSLHALAISIACLSVSGLCLIISES